MLTGAGRRATCRSTATTSARPSRRRCRSCTTSTKARTRGSTAPGTSSSPSSRTPLGVMRSPVTAIRDQVFWQWHKYIDDLNARWQDDLGSVRLRRRAAPSLVRNGLDPARDDAVGEPGHHPLPRRSTCPTEPTRRASASSSSAATTGTRTSARQRRRRTGRRVHTVDELTTTMAHRATSADAPIRFLTHEPFSYFLRIENTDDDALGVTVRIFLAPAAQAADRRTWIEMDKFLVDAPGARQESSSTAPTPSRR